MRDRKDGLGSGREKSARTVAWKRTKKQSAGMQLGRAVSKSEGIIKAEIRKGKFGEIIAARSRG